MVMPASDAARTNGCMALAMRGMSSVIERHRGELYSS
jgi:hypothetical protein